MLASKYAFDVYSKHRTVIQQDVAYCMSDPVGIACPGKQPSPDIQDSVGSYASMHMPLMSRQRHQAPRDAVVMCFLI